MAGLLNGLLDYLKLSDEDDYDDYDDYENVKEEPVMNNVRRSEVTERKMSKKSNYSSYDREEDYEAEAPKRERVVRQERSKVVPMRTASKGLEVHIVKPTSFEDSQQVCDILLEGRAVVVNLEGFDADDAQRIMDFISGCIFAINGKLHRISKYIFIFSPDNVDISGDYLDLLPEDKKNTLTINKEF